MNKLPSEKIQKSLKAVVDSFDAEDRSVRERQIREWRKLKFYWDGFTNIWWSEVAHDWKVYDQQTYEGSYEDNAYYDKRVNVYKAYLESIIAALSASIPGVKGIPDDADNSLDISTAKCAEKIAELLGKHNNKELLWLHALFIYCTEGLIAGYTYKKSDKKYGMYQEKEYAEVDEEAYLCPECRAHQEEEKMNPTDELGLPVMHQEPIICEECGAMIPPDMEKSIFKTTRFVGITEHPKSRVCMEAYGGLFVKIPTYAQTQADMPYLSFSYETHYSNVRARYEHLVDKFNAGKFGPGESGTYDSYEKWGRLSTQYLGELPVNTVTVRNTWLRPEAFNVLSLEDAKELKAEYPLGAYVILVNEEFAEACEEDLDTCWTIAKNPLADYLHSQPLGVALVSVQDITNELISLILQTIEHGIPQTFADPKVLDFNAYRQSEVAPGQIFPATQQAGKAVGEAFYEVKTATLSQEVLPFSEQIQQLGQLASGALPSLFGGAAPGTSKTASEYNTSKNQAMQRLQTTWTMLRIWWKELYGKAIPLYMEIVKEQGEDEKFVKKDKNTQNFINVFIRRAELEGKLGDIELEGAENLPISWIQKKDTLMQFLQQANPVVVEAIIDPVNLPFVAETVGLGDVTLPGEDDRQKQLEEITALINSTPIVQPPDPMMMEMEMAEGMPPAPDIELPSVEIEPDVDNHPIHIRMCKAWLVSEAGRLAKIENPDGYKNVLLHLKAHQEYEAMMMAQQAQQQMMMQGESEKGGPGKPQNDKMAAPPEVNPNAQPIH